jgi:hypothetical protein
MENENENIKNNQLYGHHSIPLAMPSLIGINSVNIKKSEKKITMTNEWRNKIQIKHLFTRDNTTSPELTITLCETLLRQLKSIKAREENGNLCDDDKYFVDEKLTELIDHFEFLINLAEGSIPEKQHLESAIKENEWSDYGFDGNYQQCFNDYLSELYDLGDVRVVDKSRTSHKFIWVY